MATVLRVKRGATTIADFTAHPFYLINFTGGAPDLRDEEFARSYEDGVELTYTRYENAEDVLDFFVAGATNAAADATWETLERGLHRALHQAQEKGDKVYLEYQPEGQSEVWRSRILQVTVHSSPLKEHDDNMLLLVPAGTTYKYIHIQLDIVRDFYWESVTEYQLTLVNNYSGSGQTVDLQNHDDSHAGPIYHNNWFTVAGAGVGGSLPAPARLVIRNFTNLPEDIRHIHVCNNSRGYANLKHLFEAEAGTLFTGASVVNESGGHQYSGTQAVQYTTTAAGMAKAIDITLDSTTLQACAGRWFRVLGLFYTANTDAFYSKLTFTVEATVIHTTTPALVNRGVIDWGMVRLPLYALQAGKYSAPITMGIYFENINAPTSKTLTLDYVLLLVCEPEEDGYRKLESQGYFIPYNYVVEIDPVSNLIAEYLYTADTYHFSTFVLLGPPPFVIPGKDQKFVLSWDANANFNADHMIRVAMYYQKRRLRL
jgi:hypothetical protein